jgi:hypothetical protein
MGRVCFQNVRPVAVNVADDHRAKKIMPDPGPRIGLENRAF